MASTPENPPCWHNQYHAQEIWDRILATDPLVESTSTLTELHRRKKAVSCTKER